MTVDLITTGALHQTSAMTMIGEGIDSKCRLLQLANARVGDTAVCWGVRHLEYLQNLYQTVIVMERGYFNDRMENVSVGIGGLNGRADFRNKNSPGDRWEKHGPAVSAWSHDGEYYVVMGQVDGDMSIQGIDIHAWYSRMFAELSGLTDKPILFRPHPLSRRRGKLPVIDGDLHEVLSSAAGVVTYNSNTGVDAALAGVPVMAEDIGSMAWDVAARTPSELLNFTYPDRTQWLYNLAYTQWTHDELRDGSAWRHICAQ